MVMVMMVMMIRRRMKMRMMIMMMMVRKYIRMHIRMLLYSLMPCAFLACPLSGMGCLDILSNCSGHGACDYCLSMCTCEEGWGAPTDVIADYTMLDCSNRECPHHVIRYSTLTHHHTAPTLSPRMTPSANIHTH
jgi:hypothetical protein